MKEKWNIYNLKLKYYHIILISMIISPLLIINSNSLNKRREQEKILKQDEIILRKLYARKLDSTPDTDDSFISDTNKICEKGSNDLKEYYKTSNTNKLGVNENEEITSENNPEYIDALINLIAGEGDSAENIKKYLMHIIPVLVFLAISILFLPGWLVCCFCSCCNCCCCCCCKKPGCKLPFYIITMVIYGLGIAISIYGLSQSNSIFVGLANTECSILKFIGEVLYGETKDTKPKWIGIDNLSETFNDAQREISSIQGSLATNLNTKKEDVKAKDNAFKQDLQDQSNNVANNIKTLSGLSGDLNGNYKLNVVELFGKFTKSNEKYTENTLMDWWYNEYIETAREAENYMESSSSSYSQLSKDNSAISALDEGVGKLSDIKDSFNQIKTKISNALIDYSEIIDNYGKLAFKIAFSVLMGINAIIAAFISIKMFFSLLSCQNKCINCLIKSLIHIFWNILAIITFVTLLLGSIFTLIGTAGKDLISVVNFLVSDENLNSEHTVLLESAPSYLTRCISGDGNITDDLGLDLDAFKNLNQLMEAYTALEEAKTTANGLLMNKFALNQYKPLYEEVVGYKSENFYFEDGNKKQYFSEVLSKVNEINSYDTWSISCSSSHSCETLRPMGNTDAYCIEPITCSTQKPSNWYGTSNDYVKILDTIIESISDIKTGTNSISSALTSLDTKYTSFLDEEISTLTLYQNTISSLVNIFINITGEDNEITNIINCKFIGKNVKVVLKFLENSLGKDFYTVGICLLVVGLASCISISFTILLNLILDAMKANNTPDEVVELGGGKIMNNDNGGALSEGVKVINYDNY